MFTKKIIAVIAMLTMPGMAVADFLSVSVGGGGWSESPSGSFRKVSDPANIDVEQDLFWKDETQGYVFVTFEHFVPFVPNVKLVSNTIDHSGSGTTSFIFDGQTFTGTVDSEVSIEESDLVLYYEVLDNVVSIDLGLNIRSLDINSRIVSGATSSVDSVSQTVPMLYGALGGSPWFGLYLGVEMSYISLSGSTLSDYTAKISYDSSIFLGFEAGIKNKTIKLDDVDNTIADLSFSGPYAALYFKFP